MEFPAHIRTDVRNGQQTDVVQTVETHCRMTAKYAGEVLSSVGLGEAAYLAGLLHDLGKFTQTFSDYLWDAHRGNEVRRGSVNHTFAGVQYLFRHGYCREKGLDFPQNISCELLGYAIGAHHGLFDLMKEKKEYGFPHRLMEDGIHYAEAEQNFLTYCADREELNARFRRAAEELTEWLTNICRLCIQAPETTNEHLMFYTGMAVRLLLSAVIEGDRRDTAEFRQDFCYPVFPGERRALWEECLSFLEQRLDTFSQEKPIQKARRTISDLCKEKAGNSGRLYRLNVPTGGGKTLASLRFALAHAKKWNRQRIFFVIPLLSIIDQNSKVIRESLPRQDIILEHHSNAVQTEENGSELDPRELLAENWSAPVIITTLVQLLNTLFSGKTTAIRRFQALCNSVVIFDEVQTVPPHMLTLFNLAVNFLTEFCGTTVVLCSATQPCLEQVPHPLVREPEELVPYEESLWAPFQRTQIQDAGRCRLEELPELVLERLSGHRSMLVVCNKKGEAEMLFHALRGRVPHLFHLSASMCMAHRRNTLANLRAVLEPESGVEEGILCISTQVIEAGVDISFDCVIRLLAGMDSAVQTAGRCNRNGESDCPAPVYLLYCTDERLTMLRDIQMARDASCALMQEFAKHPDVYQNDLASDEAIRFYYRYLYQQMKQGAQDFPVSEKNGGRDTIFDMMALNTKQAAGVSAQFFLHQAFQSAGQAFRVFDDNTVDVLVPYGAKGKRILAELCSQRAMEDIAFARQTLDAARPYTIALYQWQLDRLTEAHALYSVGGTLALALHEAYYHRETGLTLEPETDRTLEVQTCDFLI